LAVLGLELRTYTLSHFTSPFCEGLSRDRDSWNYLLRLASNCNPSDLCLLSSLDFRHEPLVLSDNMTFYEESPEQLKQTNNKKLLELKH
jgi:hypothetical protein